MSSPGCLQRSRRLTLPHTGGLPPAPDACLSERVSVLEALLRADLCQGGELSAKSLAPLQWIIQDSTRNLCAVGVCKLDTVPPCLAQVGPEFQLQWALGMETFTQPLLGCCVCLVVTASARVRTRLSESPRLCTAALT